jgi:hypothetical protein
MEPRPSSTCGARNRRGPDERPPNRKRNHPPPSFLETTRLDGVKPPQTPKPLRYKTPSRHQRVLELLLGGHGLEVAREELVGLVGAREGPASWRASTASRGGARETSTARPDAGPRFWSGSCWKTWRLTSVRSDRAAGANASTETCARRRRGHTLLNSAAARPRAPRSGASNRGSADVGSSVRERAPCGFWSRGSAASRAGGGTRFHAEFYNRCSR